MRSRIGEGVNFHPFHSPVFATARDAIFNIVAPISDAELDKFLDATALAPWKLCFPILEPRSVAAPAPYPRSGNT